MDLDTLLRDTSPFAAPTPHDLSAGRSALDAATLISARRVAAVRRAKRRGLGFSAFLAAAASVVLVAGPLLDPDNGPTTATPPVAPAKSQRAPSPTADKGKSTDTGTLNVTLVLFRAATAAGAQPGSWPDAAYWHTVSRHHQGNGPMERRESWFGHTSTSAVKDSRQGGEMTQQDVGNFGGFSWDQLYALPTESRALERKLRATSLNGGRDDDTELFSLVGSLMSETPASPALRKALWEIAARVPGVTLVGAVKDSARRPGMEIRRGDEGYILDPDDGRMLERYEGTPGPVVEAPGGADWRATFFESGPSATAPAAAPRTRPQHVRST